MRIAVNGVSARVGGGITYITNLAKGLGQLQGDFESVFFLQPHLVGRFPNDSARVRCVAVPCPSVGGLVRALWEQIALPRLLSEMQADVVFCPANLDLFRRPCPSAILIQSIHPFMPKALQYDWTWRLRLLRFMSIRSMKSADHVIMLSEAARDQVLRQCALPEGRTSVVGLGYDPIFHPSARSEITVNPLAVYGIERPYLLSVGAYQPHKNYDTLINAMNIAHKEFGINVDLALVGPVTTKSVYDNLRSLIERNGLASQVHLLSELPHEELPTVYQGAMAYLQVSYIEAFPHPLLEAMATGCPIGASTASAAPEVCQDAAIFFDPFDAKAMASTIVRLVSDSGLRTALAAKGLERVRNFLWERTASEVLTILTRLAPEQATTGALR